MKAKLVECPMCFNGSGFTLYMGVNQTCKECSGKTQITLSRYKYLKKQLGDLIKDLK